MTKKGKPIIKAVLLANLLYLSVAAQIQTITGKVVSVSDGDTITALDAGSPFSQRWEAGGPWGE